MLIQSKLTHPLTKTKKESRKSIETSESETLMNFSFEHIIEHVVGKNFHKAEENKEEHTREQEGRKHTWRLQEYTSIFYKYDIPPSPFHHQILATPKSTNTSI